MDKINRGKLVVLLGINNIGKSTQVDFLFRRIFKEVDSYVEMHKVPYYKISPLGPRICSYVHGGNPENMSPREFQDLGTLHRYQDINPTINRVLSEGKTVLLEDWVGTCFVWGMVTGVPKSHLVDTNRGLLRENCTILLDGDRFLEAKEKGHVHEDKEELIQRAREVFKELAAQFNWNIVNANESKEIVHENIWKIVQPVLV